MTKLEVLKNCHKTDEAFNYQALIIMISLFVLIPTLKYGLVQTVAVLTYVVRSIVNSNHKFISFLAVMVLYGVLKSTPRI